jgi:transglutaminase-like putative cysteine protease
MVRPLLRPLPKAATRPISTLVLIAWAAMMIVLARRSYVDAVSSKLATDLARYGSTAAWSGIYYRGEKIGFTVSQTVRTAEGFELDEDGRLQMSLLGAITAATVHTTAMVDKDFALRSFEFSIDPGTGAVAVKGRVVGTKRLSLTVTTPSGSRTDERDLADPPVLSQNLSRLLASGGLVPGTRRQWTVFDPATLANSTMTIDIGKREVVRVNNRVMPAFRVGMEFAGLRTTSWVTDTGDVVREESAMGLMTIRETPQAARAMAVPGRVRTDLLEASAVVPTIRPRGTSPFFEPRDVRRILLEIDGVDLSNPELEGVGQSVVDGSSIELRDPRQLQSGPADRDLQRYVKAEPFIESDAPEIVAEARTAAAGATSAQDRAERLTRYVNAMLDKKPTVSLPSAREVLRTKVGDCNEHTVLYVAMARALGIPSRIAVGLVAVRGAFYYHAWPEVYLEDQPGRGRWLPVDPTLNEFPADATHLRLARGGLEKQAAILPLIGKIKMTVADLELAPGSTPILVGRQVNDLGPLAIPIPKRQSTGCWSVPSRSR